MRLWKGPENGKLPAPGTSQRRLAFFKQEGFGIEGISDDGPWNLIILWHMNSDGLLDSLSLACPKGGNSYEAEYYWHVPIPPEAGLVSPPIPMEPPPDLPLVLDVAEENEG
jgi:hypothetical protein